MKTRRELLVGSGAALGIAALSGCTDVLSTGGLTVSEYDFQTTALNAVRFTVVVENLNPSASSNGTLVCQINTSSNTFSEKKQVSVPAGETNQYSITVSPSVKSRLSGSEYTTDVFFE